MTLEKSFWRGQSREATWILWFSFTFTLLSSHFYYDKRLTKPHRGENEVRFWCSSIFFLLFSVMFSTLQLQRREVNSLWNSTWVLHRNDISSERPLFLQLKNSAEHFIYFPNAVYQCRQECNERQSMEFWKVKQAFDLRMTRFFIKIEISRFLIVPHNHTEKWRMLSKAKKSVKSFKFSIFFSSFSLIRVATAANLNVIVSFPTPEINFMSDKETHERFYFRLPFHLTSQAIAFQLNEIPDFLFLCRQGNFPSWKSRQFSQLWANRTSERSKVYFKYFKTDFLFTLIFAQFESNQIWCAIEKEVNVNGNVKSLISRAARTLTIFFWFSDVSHGKMF